MSTVRIRYTMLLIALAVCTQSWAQEAALPQDSDSAGGKGAAAFIRKVFTLIDSMSVRGLDRRYIDAPERPWQFIVKSSLNQSTLKMHAKGTIDGIHYEATPYLRTEPSRYVGLWAGYRGYGLGYTVNVGGDKGSYLSFGATGGAYGLNVRLHSFENNHPHYDLNTDLIADEYKDDRKQMNLRSPIKVHTIIADGYYLFNGKHFSYAAAYDQSVIQKRSAGSLMAGGMYYYGHVDYASSVNGDLIYLMQGLGQVKLWQGSVGIGYAYNWVPTKGLLVNVMAMPMLTFVNRIKGYGYATNVLDLLEDPIMFDDDIEDDEWDDWWYSSLRIEHIADRTYNSGMTVNLDARLSLTYNFDWFFVNVYGQFNNFRYRHSLSHGHINDWFVNAAVGLRL